MPKNYVRMSGGALDSNIYSPEKKNIQNLDEWNVITPKVNVSFYEKKRVKSLEKRNKKRNKKHKKTKKRRNKNVTYFSLRRLTTEHEEHVVYIYKDTTRQFSGKTIYVTEVEDFQKRKYLLQNKDPRNLIDKIRRYNQNNFPAVIELYAVDGKADVKNVIEEVKKSNNYSKMIYYIKFEN